jgi:HEAT repeat protein
MEIIMNRWINHLIFCAALVAAGCIALVAGVQTSREYTVGQLIESLKDPDESIRARARFQLMPLADSAFLDVITLLDGDNKHAKLEAVFFINQCRTRHDDASVPALIRLLDYEDGNLQRAVIEALASLGPRARAALPKLRLILKEKRQFVSAEVTPISQRPFRFVPNALVRIQGKDALPILLEHLHDSMVSAEVRDAIATLGPSAARARAELEN